MNSAAEIENAIRQLSAGEAHAAAQWLQGYLAHEGNSKTQTPQRNAFAKWRVLDGCPLAQTLTII